MFIGRKNELKALADFTRILDNKKGGLVWLNGEMGLGKTSLIRKFFEQSTKKNSEIAHIYFECPSPVGKFKVSKLQPLSTFAPIVNRILNYSKAGAKKKLALDMGLTFLTAIPVVGDLFYAAKEFGRDWRSYKKATEGFEDEKSSSINDFYSAICEFSLKQPLIIAIDDIGWMDSSSALLLEKLINDLSQLPIVIIIAHRKGIIENEVPHIGSLIKNALGTSTSIEITLNSMTEEEIKLWAKKHILNYSTNEEFNSKLIDASDGVPAVLNEFLAFFKDHPPFNSEKHLNESALEEDFLPQNVKSVFSENIISLLPEEKNLLAICAAEGKEFTAYMVSQLINTDILTTIKKLRELMLKAPIFRSIGLQKRYGMKTTAYCFIQSFYYEYFSDLLEYEEKIALHSQIASILKLQFDQLENDQKDNLAPIIAAHSEQSGDDETVQAMIKINLDSRKNLGEEVSDEQIAHNKNINDENNIDELNIVNLVDFYGLKDAISKLFLAQKYEKLITEEENIMSQISFSLLPDELILLKLIMVRAYIENGLIEEAKTKLNHVEADIGEDANNQCLLLNTKAILYNENGNHFRAIKILKTAAKISLGLSAEYHLLTLRNIANMIANEDKQLSQEYSKAADQLAESIGIRV